jgi:hypothetical protein
MEKALDDIREIIMMPIMKTETSIQILEYSSSYLIAE